MTEPQRYQGLLEGAADYYARTLRDHGATPRGADWNGAQSQTLRFSQLVRLLADVPDASPEPSLCDLGCGYGALLDYLDERHISVHYTGIDLAQDMIAKAQSLHGGRDHVQWLQGDRPPRKHDYVIASGVFNVRGDANDDEWLDYIHHVADLMHAGSRRGFAFNCLSSRNDEAMQRPHLYYADPSAMLAHCQERYSRHVALLHDYGLYEFTMLVRKEAG